MRLFRKTTESTEIRPMIEDGSRIYAVGDIHGRLDLLKNLLEKIQADFLQHQDGRTPELVFLGDYVDRGDASQGVLRNLMELKQTGQLSTVFLKGNHEEAMLRFLDDPVLEANWLQFGGLQTLASFGISKRLVKPTRTDIAIMHQEFCGAIEPYLAFVSNLGSSHRSGDFFFCHAGVNPEKPLVEQSQRALIWGHPSALVDQPVPGKRIVHGHYDDISVIDKLGRICIDTGAYYTGVLTALRLDNGEALIQTDGF